MLRINSRLDTLIGFFNEELGTYVHTIVIWKYSVNINSKNPKSLNLKSNFFEELKF